MSEEDEYELEKEYWAKKAQNMPLIFEERYGEQFLRELWGGKQYENFVEARRNAFGVLPREIARIAVLSGNVREECDGCGDG